MVCPATFARLTVAAGISAAVYLVSNILFMPCVDRVVGEILAGWRYDISGIAPEMRVDYEQHFTDCQSCRNRQRIHRIIDFALLFTAKASAVVFLAGFLAVRHFFPTGGYIMQIIALAGVAISAVVWVIICISTPIPVMVFGAVRMQARRIHERLPEEIRAKIPETITARIAE
jgi:hypothetical protein